jgi:phosphoribosylanthranilate isomerase
MDQKIKLKVCGLRDNILEVAGLSPDYLGFIFYEKSPRFVGEDFQMPELSIAAKKVGVFVNEQLALVEALIIKHGLDFVQLHGQESPEYCAWFRQKGIGVIKAFAMEEGFDFDQLESYESVVNYFLFDTKTPGYGGSGKSFNWKILQDYRLDKMYFLSGGLNLDNISELEEVDLRKVHAVDVNSRFELRPGLKDIVKLKKLINDLSNEKISR